MARDLNVKALIGITSSGYTAVRLSHHRPKANIYIFTSNEHLKTQLSLYWGVEVFPISVLGTFTDIVQASKEFLVAEDKLESGDKFINMLSIPVLQDNRTNTVSLGVVE